MPCVMLEIACNTSPVNNAVATKARVAKAVGILLPGIIDIAGNVTRMAHTRRIPSTNFVNTSYGSSLSVMAMPYN